MVDDETETKLRNLLEKALVPDRQADELHAEKIDRIIGDLLGRARRMAELISRDGASRPRETEERQMLAFRVKRLRDALIELEKALKGVGRDEDGADDLDHIEMEAFAWNLMNGGDEGEDDDFPREADSWRRALGGPVWRMRLKADDALKWLDPKRGRGRPRGQIGTARTGEAAKILTKLRGFGVRKRSERPLLCVLLAEAGFDLKDLDRLILKANRLMPKVKPAPDTRKRRRKSA